MTFIKNTQVSKLVSTDERKQTRDCPGLLKELSDPNPTARRWAARDLLDCPGTAIDLIECLKREPEISVREVILTTLTLMGDPAAVTGLADCLRSENAFLRNEAIETMKHLPDEVAPIIKGLLIDPDPDVRIFAINILESLHHPKVENWLLEVIEGEQHVNVCATAVDLLAEIGTEAALDSLVLLKARFSDEPYFQFAAGLALKRILGE